MSIFGSILDKIFHHGTTGAEAATAAPAQATAQTQQMMAQTQPSRPATAQPLQAVDVEAVLTRRRSWSKTAAR